MKDLFLQSLREQTQPIRGASVLLWGFSGAGFPGGDGAREAERALSEVGVDTVYSHRLDPKSREALSRSYDVVIVTNTRIGELVRHDAAVWERAPKRALWFWDLRPGKVAAPLRGAPTHVFLSYRGEWTSPQGERYHPDQWRDSLGVPVGYCPQGSPMREPAPKPGGHQVLFIGDLNNAVYHRGRSQIARALGAKVINSRTRDGRLNVESRMPELYASARFSLSMSPLAPGYTSVRTYSILACGGCLLLHRFPGADEIFTDGENAILFDSTDEASAKMREADRDRIAENGRKLHATRHTVAHRVADICRRVLCC